MTVFEILERHKEDLKFLHNQPAHIVADFCKLASSLIIKGHNLKLYLSASQKLQLDVKQIQTGVEALAYLFIEAAKNKVNAEVFNEAFENLGLPKLLIFPIYEEFLSQKNLINSAVLYTKIQHLHFKNLEWRFEVKVSSKSLLRQMQPKVILKLELQKECSTDTFCLESDITNIGYMNQLLNQALQDFNSHHSKKIFRAIS